MALLAGVACDPAAAVTKRMSRSPWNFVTAIL
jgi:hypothetical protein